MSPEDRFQHILSAEPFDTVPDGSRTRGYLVELALRFGSHPFSAADIENNHVDRPVVLENFDVGELPRNRTLTDKRVLGAMLIPLGYMVANRINQIFQLTNDGISTAFSELEAVAA